MIKTDVFENKGSGVMKPSSKIKGKKGKGKKGKGKKDGFSSLASSK